MVRYQPNPSPNADGGSDSDEGGGGDGDGGASATTKAGEEGAEAEKPRVSFSDTESVSDLVLPGPEG